MESKFSFMLLLVSSILYSWNHQIVQFSILSQRRTLKMDHPDVDLISRQLTSWDIIVFKQGNCIINIIHHLSAISLIIIDYRWLSLIRVTLIVAPPVILTSSRIISSVSVCPTFSIIVMNGLQKHYFWSLLIYFSPLHT